MARVVSLLARPLLMRRMVTVEPRGASEGTMKLTWSRPAKPGARPA